MTPGAVASDDVVAARKLLRDVISETPVLHSRALSETVGGPVFLKCENLQRTGSFKVRGAYVRISRLSDAERARGVVAASAGNHAQGVAFAAGLLGCSATVVMPEGAPLPKVEATRGYGAQVVLTGTCVEDALAEALAYAERTGAVFIHPYDHPDVVAGQGTVGFEIVEQCPQVRTVVRPGGRRWPSRRRGGGDQEPGSGDRRGRRTGRSRGALPGLTGRRSSHVGAGQTDHGRRHRGQPAGRRPLRYPVSSWPTGWSRSRRRACPAACCSAWSAPSRWWSRPARRG